MRRILAIAIFSLGISCLLQGNPDRFVAEFELSKGFIVVKAIVNGQAGSYIVDSGAPGLVLNTQRHDLNSSQSIALSGVGGQFEGSLITPATLFLQDLRIQDLEAICIDLSFIEASINQPIDGLIGLNLFKGLGIVIDYGERSLKITKEDDRAFTAQPHVALPIHMEGHIPVVHLKSHGKQMRFGLDTGSRSNLIDRQSSRLLSDATILRDIQLVGTDQRVQTTSEIEVTSLTAQGIALGATTFVISDLSGTTVMMDKQLDGVLGHAFFHGRKVYINAERTQMVIVGQERSVIDMEGLVVAR